MDNSFGKCELLSLCRVDSKDSIIKLLLLVYRCTHQLAPVYLTDLVVSYVPARSLRSADQNLLTVRSKRYNLDSYGRRSFSVAGPSLRNDLPNAIRNSISLPAFRSSLKTHLFARRLSLYCRSLVLIVLLL